jgi:hypothetical protein
MFVLGTLILLIGSVLVLQTWRKLILLIRTVLVLRAGSVWILLIKGILTRLGRLVLILLPWHLRSISAIGQIWRNARDLAWLRSKTLLVTPTSDPRRLGLIAKCARLTVERLLLLRELRRLRLFWRSECWVAFVFDLRTLRPSFIRKCHDVISEVSLVIYLLRNIPKTLGFRRCPVCLTALQRTDAKAVAKQELLVDGGKLL